MVARWYTSPMDADVGLFMLLYGLTGTPLDPLILFFGEYFPFLVGIGLAIGLYRSQLPRVEQLHIFIVAMVSGVLARAGFVELIRQFIDRDRPFVAFHFDPIIAVQSASFPSGHAAFFFGVASAVAMYNKRWGVLLGIAALIISIARVIAGAHYPLDILGGAVCGIVAGYLVTFVARLIERTRA